MLLPVCANSTAAGKFPSSLKWTVGQERLPMGRRLEFSGDMVKEVRAPCLADNTVRARGGLLKPFLLEIPFHMKSFHISPQYMNT